MRNILVLLVVAAAFPGAAVAGFLDEIEDLEGKTIVYAGEFEELPCPISGKYDCLTWPHNLMRTKRKEICFSTSYYSCRFSCKGFIAVDKDNAPYVYLIDNIGGAVKKGSFERYKCPSLY